MENLASTHPAREVLQGVIQAGEHVRSSRSLGIRCKQRALTEVFAGCLFYSWRSDSIGSDLPACLAGK